MANLPSSAPSAPERDAISDTNAAGAPSTTGETGAPGAPGETDALDVSIVIPVYNEEANVAPLCERLAALLARGGFGSTEVIVVDDGSTDGTLEALRTQAARLPFLKVLAFRRNYGQTPALSAGFDAARGRVIIPMDGDLQNDPDDIPLLIARLDEGFDVVSGWRKNRQDDMLKRKIPSMIANKLISWVTGVHLNDYGCTLKAYRAEVLKGVRLYGEMHRFIPVYAHWEGARITEMPVRHHPRTAGTSKYGIIRTFKVILDLMTVKFLGDFAQKPIYLFGAFGLVSALGATVMGLKTLYERMVLDIPGVMLIQPTLLTMLLILSTVLFLSVGILAEILLRIFHENRNQKTYRVREVIQGAAGTTPAAARNAGQGPPAAAPDSPADA
ncbi:MAG: glycosyltransferase family 2 protein [Desulfovibrionaceae bacterium]|jgi:dolichol-phosphate mannosyltransferase|nr:glycosyltransferase family 2 protein [Desulfovibrionaceae bacterium]